MTEKKGKKNSLLIKISVALLVVLAVFISWEIFQQINKRNQIQNEITQLQQEAEKISRDNLSTQERISYFETQNYQEREAKDKLNLKNPDETVVIIKPGVEKGEAVGNSSSEEITSLVSKPATSNILKWWNYFTSK